MQLETSPILAVLLLAFHRKMLIHITYTTHKFINCTTWSFTVIKWDLHKGLRQNCFLRGEIGEVGLAVSRVAVAEEMAEMGKMVAEMVAEKGEMGEAGTLSVTL